MAAFKLPVRFPVTLPVKDPPDNRVIPSAWIFAHLKVLDPKLYVESREGTISLD